MRKYLSYLVVFALCWFSPATLADALMKTEAMKASTIAEYYVEAQGVRVELEIGVDSIKGFRNLLPDGIYQDMGFGDTAWEERLSTFFSRELTLLVKGKPLAGRLLEIVPSRRVLRDLINGTPLPIQDEAPEVLRAVLEYPFPEGELPSSLVLTSPGRQDIGFVVYHQGVTVNDFRYLASGYLLELDWQDPWYSSFASRSLKRQYSSPMSAFIYVENFEVRKEVIVRPKDLQRWVDLGLEGRTDIPVDMQGLIKEKIAAFLTQRQAVVIDGKPVKGILDSVNFLERTLTSSRVIDPPQDLNLDAAIIGTIFVYPRSALPQQVTMEWDLWDERIQRIPVSAVDQAGPLPSYLEQDWPVLVWTNYLKNPRVPSLVVVEAPVASWALLLGKIVPLLVVLAMAAVLWTVVNLRGRRSPALPIVLAGLLAAASAAAAQLGGSNQPDPERAGTITGDLLHNVYRAFDYREETEIYDVLAQSVTGELLTDIFLETKRSLVLANQGGASAKVKNVTLESIEVKPNDTDNSFTVEADWTVHGSVGHWGHIHQRSNRYLALLTIAVDGQRWKLQSMTVLQEERL